MRAKAKPTRYSCSGITKLEVLVVVVIVGMLFGLVLPSLIRAKSLARYLTCTGQLKNIGLSLRIFATDNTDAFPFQVSTNSGGTREWNLDPLQAWRHFAWISNELGTPVILKCPSDRERRVARDWKQFTNNSHLSYFVGINATAGNSQSVLAGDRNLVLAGPSLGDQVVTFPTNAAVAFDGRIHEFAGNIAVGDGSAQQVTSSRLAELFRDAALVGTNTLLIP